MPDAPSTSTSPDRGCPPRPASDRVARSGLPSPRPAGYNTAHRSPSGMPRRARTGSTAAATGSRPDRFASAAPTRSAWSSPESAAPSDSGPHRSRQEWIAAEDSTQAKAPMLSTQRAVFSIHRAPEPRPRPHRTTERSGSAHRVLLLDLTGSRDHEHRINNSRCVTCSACEHLRTRASSGAKTNTSCSASLASPSARPASARLPRRSDSTQALLRLRQTTKHEPLSQPPSNSIADRTAYARLR